MKHGRSFAELALAVAAMLLVAACGKGPGEPPEPLPTWSPPTWMHGSWSGTGMVTVMDMDVLVTATVEVSAYNLVASFEAGGEAHGLDLADLTEKGVASIQRSPGVPDGQYDIVITPNVAGGSVNSFICGEEDSTTMTCIWAEGTSPDIVERIVVLTKQPG